MKICPVCSSQYTDDVKFCPNDGQTLRGAAPATNLVGQVVADRYHIIKKLGEGGMGQVYLGEHVKMGRRSAIKVMNPSMVHDPDAVARFNREAANASRITHPNVCAIYDFGETPDGLIYLAMEFIEGEPLTDVLQREDALSVHRAVNIFQQTGEALQAAHDLGIVHRDLKPDNIMISRGRDGSDVVKVVDFGIAKAMGGEEAAQKVTKTGLVVGTPEVMSPEQLAGDKVDGRSDLYSLALVFFRMLTGRLPFEGETVQETMIKRLTDEPAKLATLRGDLSFPAGLQGVLDSALTRTPKDRYQTVVKFADDVRSVTGVRSAPTRAPVPVTRAGADGATQLMDTTATKQMGARKQKRSLVPVVIGAAVLLGGAGAAVKLLGGNKDGDGQQADSTSRTAGGASDTPRVQTNPGTTPRQPDSGRRTPDSSRSTVTRPRVDSAAIDRELGDMIIILDDVAQRPRLRSRTQAIYENTDVPKHLRADAAFTLANLYLQDQRVQESCRWLSNAVRLEPNNQNYRQFQSDRGCT